MTLPLFIRFTTATLITPGALSTVSSSCAILIVLKCREAAPCVALRPHTRNACGIRLKTMIPDAGAQHNARIDAPLQDLVSIASAK
jgi:hypothetical protein